jgi:hypothetical protein
MTDTTASPPAEWLATVRSRATASNARSRNEALMESRHRMSADKRLFFAAAAHHDLVADSHDKRAARHERDGEKESAARERTLAQQAREKAQLSRDHAARCAS